VVEELSHPWTLKDYVQANVANMQKLLTDFKPVSHGTTTIDGMPASWMIYNHRMGAYKLKVIVYLMVKDKRGYVITCSSVPARFAQWQKSFQNIAMTFQFQK